MFEGNIIQDIQGYNVISVYMDQFLTKKERARRIEQGIDDDDVINRIRVDSKLKSTPSDEQKAVASAYGNRFCILLGEMFEMVKHLPFTGIGDRLSLVLRFAAYSDVI